MRRLSLPLGACKITHFERSFHAVTLSTGTKIRAASGRLFSFRRLTRLMPRGQAISGKPPALAGSSRSGALSNLLLAPVLPSGFVRHIPFGLRPPSTTLSVKEQDETQHQRPANNHETPQHRIHRASPSSSFADLQNAVLMIIGANRDAKSLFLAEKTAIWRRGAD
jgi:hypothetical protein